jgi:DNA repair ATPase RecN
VNINRWWFDRKNLKNITIETVLPENDKKQEYINLIIPIIYQPFQVIFTDVVDGGIDRDVIFNNIEKIANINDLYTYITNGIIKISNKDDNDCWKRLYNITETSLFNKIFDRVNDFYDELLASNYYSKVENYDVYLLLSKYVYQFDNEKLELLDKRLNNYKNIETKLNFKNDNLMNYENLEISFIDSSEKEIIKLFNTK